MPDARGAPIAVLAVAVVVLGGSGGAAAGDLRIRDVRIPGRDGRMSVGIVDGKIAAIDPAAAASGGEPVVDGAGGWLVPGLIDSHVHLSVVPGSGQRGDDAASIESQMRAGLAGYLASGVTTVLDTGISPEALAQIRLWLAGGSVGPRVLSLGPAFVTPGGYLSDLVDGGGIASVADVEPHFELLETLDVAGIKVALEKGFGPSEVWPIHPPEIRRAITEGARRRGLPIYVHGTAEDEQQLAIEMGAHALVHTGFADAPPSDAFVAALHASGAYVMTTFGIFDAQLIRFEPERLDAPLMQLVVPRVQLETARDPESGVRLAEHQIAMSMPSAPGFVHSFMAWLFLDEGAIRDLLAGTLAAARTFHEAGVPIIVGSDSGNWPMVPYQFHGPTTIREIELLAASGWSPAEALAAATTLPAKMLGLDTEIGAVAVGMRADLLVLGADPAKDVGALRDVRYTIQGGDARTPAEWMAAAKR